MVRRYLAEHAKSLTTSAAREPIMSYPMYTAALDSVLAMESVQSHEELLQEELLVEFHRRLGKAMFVSHQWASNLHADPDGRQFKVLQGALSNLLTGEATVSPDALTEMLYGKAPSFHKCNLTSQAIFIWYDFFSVPQIAWKMDSMALGTFKQPKAIASIPAYIDRCEFFVCLCPVLTHLDTQLPMDQYTWAKRGWCRVERMVRQLLAPRNFVLLIESPRHMSLLSLRESLFHPFGQGEFSVESDRRAVGLILRDILEIRLHNLLREEKLEEYRFFLNRQDMLFRDCDLPVIPSLLPPASNHELSAVDEFMYENGFLNVCERDGHGYSPLCYAVVRKNPELTKALLTKRANPNDTIWKRDKASNAPRHLSVLSICVLHHNHEALRLLLEARADVNHRDANRSTPILYTAFSHDSIGAKMLLAYRADPSIKNIYGFNTMDAVFSQGATAVAQELWSFVQKPSLLHAAMWMAGGDPDFVEMVVDRGIELNHPYEIRSFEHQLLFGFFSMKYRLGSRSRMSQAAYHQSRATPLMLSILTGKFSAAQILLRAGARVDLRNARNRTAFDFAVEVQAPSSLFRELVRCGADQHTRRPPLLSLSSWEGEVDEDDPMISVKI